MNTTTMQDPAPDVFDLAATLEEQQEAEARKIMEEEAAVAAWEKRIKEARDFDKNARTQYAIDRAYVGGEAGRGNFDITVNIAGTYVDILVAFLYAKDPAADVLPAESCGPSRLEMARQLGKTLEIVIAKTWKKAALKRAARPFVRSGLSIGIGWLKAAWHEKTGHDPIMATKLDDLQDNLRRLECTRAELASGEADDPDALRASIRSQIEGLQANVETLVSRGMVIDFVSGEDVQVAPECPRLEDYLDSPWIAHRAFLPVDDAKEKCPAIKDLIDQATIYQQIQPRAPNDKLDAPSVGEMRAEDADTFRAGESINTSGNCGPAHVCIWEIQSRDDNMIYTIVEGVKRWARPPYPPRPSSRFYNLFQWAPLQVDGKRHPDSLPKRSASQLDEYNRLRSNLREHRRRAIPKLGFNKRAVDKDQAAKMEAGGTGEMIGLDVMGEDPKSVLFPIQYNQVDMALYDTAQPRQELEMIWGIQEALSSTIRTAKTLGEAEIQQSGTEAREGHKRDSLEEALTDLAIYTAELALQKYDDDDVRAMAGPEAFWPATEEDQLTIEDLDTLVSVEIRAGSSGKPNTRLRQEQWATVMPQLREAIQVIAQLRQSNPLDTANCIEQIVVEMLERVGDRVDPQRFLPKPGQPVPLLDPATGQTVLAFPARCWPSLTVTRKPYRPASSGSAPATCAQGGSAPTPSGCASLS